MKIKIAYQQQEEQQAQEIARLIKQKYEPSSAVKESRSDRHAPFIHTYLAITPKMTEKN